MLHVSLRTYIRHESYFCVKVFRKCILLTILPLLYGTHSDELLLTNILVKFIIANVPHCHWSPLHINGTGDTILYILGITLNLTHNNLLKPMIDWSKPLDAHMRSVYYILISSDNVLSPTRCKATTWNNVTYCSIDPTDSIVMKTVSFSKWFEIVVWKWRPFCVTLGVLSSLRRRTLIKDQLLTVLCCGIKYSEAACPSRGSYKPWIVARKIMDDALQMLRCFRY